MPPAIKPRFKATILAANPMTTISALESLAKTNRENDSNYASYIEREERQLVSEVEALGHPIHVQKLFEIVDTLQQTQYYKAPIRVWKAILKILGQAEEME